MITTSQAYKDMMKEREMRSRIVMSIDDGEESVTLVNKDIVEGSLGGNWRASNNKEFSIGTCYSTSFSFSSFKAVETKVDGNNLVITPTLYYEVEGGEQEIPLGVFYCSEPTMYLKTTAYDCYDGMLFFDVDVPSRFSGTPYNVASFICSECGMQLGTTQSEFSRFPNGAQTVVVDPADVRTYRDALSYLAKVTGTYCIMDRYGRLSFRQFHTTPDMELVRKRRCKPSFAGYKTIFRGVKCRFKAEQNYYPYEHVGRDYGIMIDLGDIPVIEDTERVKRAILSEIWEYLKDVEYYPCSIDMVGDPSIEAGDMIVTKDSAGYDKNVLLTSVTFNWRKVSNITSEGGNPKYQNVSTVQKRTEQKVEQQAIQSTVVTSTYVNAGPITVNSDARTEITSLRFVTNKDLTAIFGAEIPVYSTGDGYVNIEYSNNGLGGDVVRARVTEGWNLVTLVNHLHYDANAIVLLQLKAQTEGIGAGTAPIVSINEDTIRSYIFAQGLEVEAPWDGIIQISEEVGYVRTQMALYGLTESVVVSSQLPAERVLSEMVTAMNMKMQMREISDTMTLTLEYGDQILRMGQGHRAGMGRMYVRW